MAIGVSSNALKDLQQIINMHVKIVPEENNEYFTKVLDDNDVYRIYVYNSIANRTSEDLITNNLYLFFIRINCKLADWTQYQLFNYIRRFPLQLFYNSKFDYKYKNVTNLDHENQENELIFIAEHVEIFVNLLYNFLDITGPYYDTSLLMTLVSLQFKMEYILFSINVKRQPKVEISDKTIVKIVIEIMIAIQKFKTTNCPLQEPKFNDKYSDYINEVKQFYGFWIQYHPMSKETIEDYLKSLRKYIVVKSLSCTVKKTLLERFILDAAISNELANVKVILKQQSNKNSIRELFDKVSQNHDLELTFLFMESIFDTIMKLLCIKTFEALDEIQQKNQSHQPMYDISDDIMKTFMTINFLILTDTNYILPNYLTNCFAILASKKQFTLEELKKHKETIENYSKTIDNIIIFDVDKEPTSKQLIVKTKLLTLTEFTDIIQLYYSDLECFKRLHKFLRIEYSKYYIPFLNNSKKINNFIVGSDEESLLQKQQSNNNMDVDQFNDQCNYISGLRNLCFGIDLLLKFIGDKNENKKSEYQKIASTAFLKKVNIIFITIKKLSLKVIDHCAENINRDLLKMSYDIYILFNYSFEDKNNMHTRKPLLYAIMTYLNTYSINNCVSPNFLFSNTDFGVLKNINKLSKRLNEYINSLEELNLNKLNKETVSKSKVLDINGFYNEHVQNSPVFTRYGKRLIFFWKGEKKYIYEIFENIKSIILNHSHVLEFYNIYFKFIITTLFCEITVVFDDLKLDYDNRSKSKVDLQKYANFHELFNGCLMKDNYPKYFSEILTEIRLFLSYVFDQFYNKITVSTNLIENTSGKHFDGDNVGDEINNIVLNVNTMKIQIENRINEIGIFIGFQLDEKFDGLIKTFGEIIKLAKNAKDYYFSLLNFKEIKGQHYFLTKEFCDSVILVNEMITNNIINV